MNVILSPDPALFADSDALGDEYRGTIAAGAVTGTVAPESGMIRTVTDTGSKITIGGDNLNFATGATANDGIWYPVKTRVVGQTFLCAITPSNTDGIINVGFDANTSGAVTDCLRFAAAGALQIVPNGGTAIVVGAYTAVAYKIKCSMRATGIEWMIKGGAFANWTFLWNTAAGTAAGYPCITVGSTTSVFTAQWLRPLKPFTLSAPIASDSFNRADGAIGSTDGAGHAEATGLGAGGAGLAWTGAGAAISGNALVITPTAGAEILADPGLEGTYTAGLCAALSKGGAPSLAQSADVRGGSKAQEFTATANLDQLYINATVGAGAWNRYSVWAKRTAGTAGTTGIRCNGIFKPVTAATYSEYVYTARGIGTILSIYAAYQAGAAPFDTIVADDMRVTALSLSTLFSSLVLSTANVLAEVAITRSNSALQAGLVLNLDSAATPANFVIVYTSGASILIEKCVAGVYTTVATTAYTYSAGAVLRVIKSGSSYRVYYGSSLIGAVNTISDAGIVDNKLHGCFSTSDTNSFKPFNVYACGDEGQFSILDRWSR